MTCCFFFFSSRRRHTRYIGDWSSDVCSSDLIARPEVAHRVHDGTREADGVDPPARDPACLRELARELVAVEPLDGAHRSEERRVGKEGGSASSPDAEKTKRKDTTEHDEY